jgi:phospholipid/cholesterol/gamma-HCH transport system ATP-binding protein
MDPSAPVLDLAAARPQVGAGEAPALEIDLRLMAGELALVDARHSARPAWLADLCCGLVPLGAGTARFLGRDWSGQNFFETGAPRHD